MQLKRTQNGTKRGFTLIELLVVILILAILAALIVPRVVGRTSDAKRAKAASDIASLSNAIDTFRLDVDRYPSTEEGLNALVSAPADANGWKGKYINKLPADPWGNEYVYEYPGTSGDDSFLIVSYGADGAPGGEGEAEDVTAGEE